MFGDSCRQNQWVSGDTRSAGAPSHTLVRGFSKGGKRRLCWSKSRRLVPLSDGGLGELASPRTAASACGACGCPPRGGPRSSSVAWAETLGARARAGRSALTSPSSPAGEERPLAGCRPAAVRPLPGPEGGDQEAVPAETGRGEAARGPGARVQAGAAGLGRAAEATQTPENRFLSGGLEPGPWSHPWLPSLEACSRLRPVCDQQGTGGRVQLGVSHSCRRVSAAGSEGADLRRPDPGSEGDLGSQPAAAGADGAAGEGQQGAEGPEPAAGACGRRGPQTGRAGVPCLTGREASVLGQRDGPRVAARPRASSRVQVPLGPHGLRRAVPAPPLCPVLGELPPSFAPRALSTGRAWGLQVAPRVPVWESQMLTISLNGSFEGPGLSWSFVP